MNYIESFDLLGTEAKQIPSILGEGAPTEATEGAVGCLYMDTTNGDLYKCTVVAGDVYTWNKIGDNPNIDDEKLRLQNERLQYYGDGNIIPTDASHFSFTTDDETMTASVVKLNKSVEDIVIPYKYTIDDKTYIVAEIGEEAFRYAKSIISVIIPNSVTNIKQAAFRDCSNITRLTIPNSVTSIGKYAFLSVPKVTFICSEKSIADSYAKANGIPVIYTGELTKKYVDVVTFNDIPEYWNSHLKEKIKTIRSLQRDGGKDCYSFIVITDFHCGANPCYSPTLIKKVAEACNIKYCLCLGDVQTGAALETKESVIAQWEQIHDIFTPIKDFTLMTGGNHDGAYGRYDINGNGTLETNDYYCYNLSKEEMYDVLFRRVSLINGVKFDATNNGYYVDDEINKVRYILLNSHYADDEKNEDGTNAHLIMRSGRLGQGQYDLVSEALNSIPDDEWNVVVGCHMPICFFSTDGGGGDLSILRNMLIAYQNRTLFSDTFSAEGEYDYVVVNEDFSNAKGRVIGAFSGHMHNDLSNQDYDFPIIVSAADNYESLKIIEGGGITSPGELGTTTEQSFDVFTVNKRSNIVYATKIGKGNDRIFSLNGICDITLNLNDAYSSNSMEHVPTGESYETTISVGKEYAIQSVSITMDGIDITSSVYSDGNINITEVTGDIVITVETIKLYDNLVELDNPDCYVTAEDGNDVKSGKEGGYYLNGSGTLTEQTNKTYTKKLYVSHFIPVEQGDIIRFKGLNMEAGVVTGDAILAVYKEDKTFMTRRKLSMSTLGTSLGLEADAIDENGVASYEILVDGETGDQISVGSVQANLAKYVRFSIHYTDTPEDIIITKNQEIV